MLLRSYNIGDEIEIEKDGRTVINMTVQRISRKNDISSVGLQVNAFNQSYEAIVNNLNFSSLAKGFRLKVSDERFRDSGRLVQLIFDVDKAYHFVRV